jgi:general secretion pathway protein D
VALVLLWLSGCGVSNPPVRSEGHIDSGATPALADAPIPRPVGNSPYLPAPKPRAKVETYTVVVNRVPLRELLFALARDAKLNIDIVGDIDGRVTLNAIDQTLLKILDRISLQAPIRYELRDDYLIISADDPYLQAYKIDYLNIARTSSSQVDLATQVGSISLELQGTSRTAGNNNSQTSVKNTSDNLFWDSLIGNVAGMLGMSSDAATKGGNGSEPVVVVNRETGYMNIKATRRQHDEIQSFIDKIMSSARRQVLIEATIVEVTLSDEYQAGIDWSILQSDGSGLDFVQSLTGSTTAANNSAVPNALFTFTDPSSALGRVTATLKALETFGDVQILSSPKIIAMNNQMAVLKVVDNRVYFTVDVQHDRNDGISTTTVTSSINTVPVGFVMNVTPFISEAEEVILNVRPTISRILGYVSDPNPELSSTGIENRIPEIQVREMESLLRVSSGQVAIIGGLMQDRVDNEKSGIPLLSSLPLIGGIFSYQRDAVEKTELLVFLRPTVVNNASLNADLKQFRRYLPEPLPPQTQPVSSPPSGQEIGL